MKKVVYSVIKQGKFENTKITGVGFVTDTDLIIACVSKNNKPYIRVFEDCVKNCHAVIGKTDEFKGAHYEIRKIEFDVSGGKETREIEVSYYLWYKFTD